MIQGLLPGCVRTTDHFGDCDTGLFPLEQDFIASAVKQRQDEFATVRACARAALDELSYPAVSLVPGEGGAPTWPQGVVGSLTHCAGYRAAAVALASEVASLGIDAEPNASLPAGVLDIVCAADDQRELCQLPRGGVAWDRVLFSAKESIYKTWYPIAHRWLGFEDAHVTIDPSGTFHARLLVDGLAVDGHHVRELTGRWRARHGFVVTASWLTAAAL